MPSIAASTVRLRAPARRSRYERGVTWRSAVLIVVAAGFAPACVTVVGGEAPPQMLQAQPLFVPMQGAGGGAVSLVDRYYASIVQQLHEAVTERDVEQARTLLAQHDRKDAPVWVRERMGGFRAAVRGLEFAAFVVGATRVGPRVAPGAVGAPLDLAVELVGAPTEDAAPAAASGVLAFWAHVELRDTDAFGSRTRHATSQILRVPADHQWGPASVVSLPFRVDVPGLGVVRRELRVDVELLPGLVRIGDASCPVPRLPAATHASTHFPRGVDPIREQPLRTLRNALQRGTSRYFGHLFLAASFMPATDRHEAADALIDWVRLGNRVRARVAMGCLRELTGVDLSVEDREGWLRWWGREVAAHRK
ncbi:MAG: hypothetical protein AAF628_17850 [Planctomycetota bacterium]